MPSSQFKKVVSGRDTLSASEWNKITSLLTSLAKGAGQSAILDSTGLHIRESISGGVGLTRRAKTTIGWTSGSTVLAKLLDEAGAITTEEITVNFFFSWDDAFTPRIPINSTIPVYQDVNEEWYCPYTLDIDLRIAKITSDATGGGYYNCTLQDLHAGADWNVDSRDVFNNDTGESSIVVLNLAEHNSDTHDLSVDDQLVVWKMLDKAEATPLATEWIGISTSGSTGGQVFRAKIINTTNAAALGTVSVQKVDAGNGFQGDPFEAYVLWSQDPLPLSSYRPDISLGGDEHKWFSVTQDQNGTWHLLITLERAAVCNLP